jgi:hypothetical protein
MTPLWDLTAVKARVATWAKLFLAPTLLVGAALLVPRVGWPASLRELKLDDMVALSEEIVVGHVVSSEARWHGKLIVTISKIEVSESLKGQAGRQIEITQLGGTAVHPVIGAPVTMTASDQVALRSGENVLLFVSKTKSGVRQLVGGAQGKFVVREETATGTTDLPVGPKQLKVVREGDLHVVSAEAMPLGTMRERIRSCLRRQQKPPGGKPR